MKLHDLLDPGLFVQMVEEGMVSATRHPECEWYILGYTQRAQYSRTWNEVTEQCRGLIVNGNPLSSDTEVISRPFRKFWNVGEHDGEAQAMLPDQPFDVFAKMDGSLGILYVDPHGLPEIATRGSFQSDQAIWATKHYRETYNSQAPPEGVTLLFEIIYPENRIVVDYGDRKELVLLAAIDTETGADVELPPEWPGPVVHRFDGMGDLAAISELCASNPKEYANSEGFVLRFRPAVPGGRSIRAKAKFSEYVRLHRIVTGVSSKTIWEHLSNDQPLDELLDRVPDEFYDWVNKTADEMRLRYQGIVAECYDVFNARPIMGSRKEMAEYFAPFAHRAVLFRMLDDRDYSDLVWKSLKPTYERPFRTDTEA